MFTNSVYLSSDVEIDYKDDFYSIKATRDLPVGHLVLIEHVMWGDVNYLVNGVMRDRRLFKTLHPRHYDTEDIQKAIKKTYQNCFIFDESHVLGYLTSKFNHSCIPNCHLDVVDFVDLDKFYGVWTHRKVLQGQELTFDYVNKGDIPFHDSMKKLHQFCCECTEEYILGNAQRSKIHVDLGDHFRKRDTHLVNTMVDTYLATNRGRQVSQKQKELRQNIKKAVKNGDFKCIEN
jgi:hypothetical protein